MDLSAILASPKISKTTKADQNVKSKLDQVDKILNNINSYNTTKYDIEDLNREAKIEAKKGFYEEIDGLQLNINFPKFDQFKNLNFNKICSQIHKGLDKHQTIFNGEQLLLFKRNDFYEGEEFNEKLAKKVLMKNDDKLKMLKTGLKMISVESDLDNIMIIKRILINEMATASIEDIYSTLLKILINFGINLKLLDQYVIKYQNIKNSKTLTCSSNDESESDSNECNNLNLMQSFVHIVDLIEISVNSSEIQDKQLMADYISIVLILYSDKKWRYNTQCLNAMSQLFVTVLKRIRNSHSSIKIVSRKIHKFFADLHTDFLDFLDLFPDRTDDLSNIKSIVCKRSLKKYGVKIAYTDEGIDGAFEDLQKLELSDEEFKLVVSLMDHYFGTNELTDSQSQQISDHLLDFMNNYSFEQENQRSIEFKDFLCDLVRKYDKKSKEKSAKKRKVKGEHGATSKSRKLNNSIDFQKAWEDIELESELNGEIFSNSD